MTYRLLLVVLLVAVPISGPAIAQQASTNTDDDASTSPVEPLPPRRSQRTACPKLTDLGYQTKNLIDLSVNIGLDPEELPPDCSTEVFRVSDNFATTRPWMHTEFNWAASDLFHQPAYWDDPILERYGQSHHPWIQPALSGAHFFATFPLIPYKIGVERTHDHIYTLGYHRPGSPTPALGRRLSLEADAAAFEGLSWLALIFILP